MGEAAHTLTIASELAQAPAIQITASDNAGTVSFTGSGATMFAEEGLGVGTYVDQGANTYDGPGGYPLTPMFSYMAQGSISFYGTYCTPGSESATTAGSTCFVTFEPTAYFQVRQELTAPDVGWSRVASNGLDTFKVLVTPPSMANQQNDAGTQCVATHSGSSTGETAVSTCPYAWMAWVQEASEGTELFVYIRLNSLSTTSFAMKIDANANWEYFVIGHRCQMQEGWSLTDNQICSSLVT